MFKKLRDRMVWIAARLALVSAISVSINRLGQSPQPVAWDQKKAGEFESCDKRRSESIRRKILRSPWLGLIPVLLLIVINLGFTSALEKCEIGYPRLGVNKEGHKLLAGDNSVKGIAARSVEKIARLKLETAWVLLVAADVILVGFSGVLILKYRRRCLLAVLATSAAVEYLLLLYPPVNHGVTPELLNLAARASEQGHPWLFNWVEFVANLTQILAAIGIVFAGAASGCVLARQEHSVDGLARQAAELRVLLYCSAALLVAGLMAIFALHMWPLTFLGPDSDGVSWKPLRDLVAMLTLSSAVIHTMSVAAVYIPSALLIQSRFRDALRSENPHITTKAIELSALKHGLKASWGRCISEFTAVASPVITGLILPLLANITKL